MLYGHSIKNPHIKHFIRKYAPGEYHFTDEKYRYLCSNSYTPSKGTQIRERVSCKKCLRELKKMEDAKSVMFIVDSVGRVVPQPISDECRKRMLGTKDGT